jgi:hypothetical protein
VRGQESKTPWYGKKLKDLATRLWKNRYLFFKSDKNLTPEDKERMLEIVHTDKRVSFMRGFLEKVWSIFETTKTQAQARKQLEALKKYGSLVISVVYNSIIV